MCLWFFLQVVHKSGFEKITKKTNTKDPCAVCMWYRGIRQSGLEQDTEIQINGKWYPILTWPNYWNTNTENLCAYGIHSRLEQNTETQIQRIFVHVVSSGPAPGDSSKSGLFAEESPQSSASFSSYSPEGLFSTLLWERGKYLEVWLK